MLIVMLTALILADPNPQVVADASRANAMVWRVIALNDRPTGSGNPLMPLNSDFAKTFAAVSALPPGAVKNLAIAQYDAAVVYRSSGDSAVLNGDSVITAGDYFYGLGTSQGFQDATLVYAIALKRYTAADGSFDAASNSLAQANAYVLQGGGKP